MRVLARFLTIAVVVCLIAASAFAQTTASLTGEVRTEGKPLPGATVTISSPNLQGTRTAVRLSCPSSARSRLTRDTVAAMRAGWCEKVVASA